MLEKYEGMLGSKRVKNYGGQEDMGGDSKSSRYIKAEEKKNIPKLQRYKN